MRKNESGTLHLVAGVTVVLAVIFCLTAFNISRTKNLDKIHERNSEFVGSTNSLSDKQIEYYVQRDLKYLFNHSYSKYYKNLNNIEKDSEKNSFEQAINLITKDGGCTFITEKIDKSPGVKILDGPAIKVYGTGTCGAESFKVSVDFWGQYKGVGDPNVSRAWNFHSIKIDTQNSQLIGIADKFYLRGFRVNYKDRQTGYSYNFSADTKGEVDSILKLNKIGKNCTLDPLANTAISQYDDKVSIDVNLTAACDQAKEYRF